MMKIKNLLYLVTIFFIIIVISSCKDAQEAVSTASTSTSSNSDGENGANGKNSIIKTSTESAGSNCSSGGVKIESGLDSDSDNNLDSNEITSTQYVCNGNGIKPSASYYCGAQLQNTSFYYTYNAMLFSDNSVYAYGGIYGASYQIGASTYYDSSQTGAQTAAVLFLYDVSGSANGGYWKIYVDRINLASTIEYTDSDVSGGKTTWSLNSSSSNCVLNRF